MEERGSDKGINPNLKPWKPGQSGNPGGRPKAFAEMVSKAQEHSPAIVTMLYEIAIDPDHKPSDRVMAGREILDRAWGKPSQQAELTINEKPSGETIDRTQRASRAEWLRNVIQDKQKIIEMEQSEDVETTAGTTTSPH